MAITPKVPGQISAPNTLTGEAVGTVSAPNTLTGEAVGVVAAPNTLTGEAVGSVSAPNTLTANAVGSVSAPNTLTSEAVGSVSAPNTLVGVTPAAFPRTLTPLVDMNFATQSYAQSGTPVAFDDLFTYSRASSATFTNRRAKATGGYDYFLDTDYVGDVTNLVTYSEQFDNAAWGKQNITVSHSLPVAVAELSNTSDKLIESNNNALHRISQPVDVIAGNAYTLSGYFKADERSVVVLNANSLFAARGSVDLLSGAVVVNNGEISAIPVADGWYRVVAKGVATITQSIGFYIQVNKLNTGIDESYQGDGTSGLYAWGVQLTESAKPLPYVKTLDAPVTQTFTETLRTEYDPATGENLGALIEGGSTNLATWSEEFSNTAYIKSGTTVTTNTITAPDGTLSGDKVNDDVSNGVHRILTSAGIPISTTTETTYSIYAKADGITEVKLTDNDLGAGIVVNLLNGEIISGTGNVKSAGNGWYRISHSKINSTGTGRIVVLLSVNGSQSYVGTNSGVYIWGAQVEALPFATSYIRTEGAAVSRSADSLSLPSAGNFNASEYSVLVEGNASGTSQVNTFASVGDGTNANNIQLTTYTSKAFGYFAVSGSVVQGFAGTGTITNDKVKGALTYTFNDLKGYYNEELFSNDTSFLPLQNTTVILIGSVNNTAYLSGHISKFATYDKALTAQEITLL